jgi:hypothetical protein
LSIITTLCIIIYFTLLVTKGNAEFDPIGFAEYFDPKWLREAELKHGRVAMLATVGWLVQVGRIILI